MSDKRSNDRAGHDSAKSWLEQRKQKISSSASFAPHTPPAQRSLSTFSSPGSILGKEEDVVIIELTPRCLFAGIEGESGPQCQISFGPTRNRRVDDYREWMPGYKRRTERLGSWGRDYELWRNDLRDVDLGLLSDVMERTVREAYLKHLLIDAGASRLVLVLPSIVPHPVIETILSTLFQRWRYPAITLLPSPTMALISAGLRSGLVVDFGWEETTVTSIYEYREISSHRSTRATKLLTKSIAQLLMHKREGHAENGNLRFDLDFIEEVTTRMMAIMDSSSKQAPVEDEETQPSNDSDKEAGPAVNGADIIIEWPNGSGVQFTKIPRQELTTILSQTYLGEPGNIHPDDNETALPQLMFQSLLSLSPDVRGICMSRIVFTGRISSYSLLRHQILHALETLIEKEGWTPVRGAHAPPTQRNSTSHSSVQTDTQTPYARHNEQVPAEKDFISEKFPTLNTTLVRPPVQGTLREVHSLGSWSGASLLTSLKVRGLVEIERDRFLSHGLSGASRDVEVSVVPQQRMSSFGKPSDRNSWTLGGWG